MTRACLLAALLISARPALAQTSRDRDPYGWLDYTRQLRQEESRRIDRMLDNTYGPNPRSTTPDLTPLANSLHSVFSSLAEARRQRAEEKAFQTTYLIELYRLQQQKAEEQARQAQAERWTTEWDQLRREAQAGDATAAANVARLIRYGSQRLPKGTKFGEKEALPWLELAAGNGDARSAFDSGILLRNSNPKEALRYLTLAAERGFIDAVPFAANLADEGAGSLQPNRAEALRILGIGVAQHHKPSLVTAARFACLDPTATAASYRQAVAWLTEAAPEASADGLLAQLLYHGRPGVEVDIDRARALAERSLARDSRQRGAKEVLGLCLVSAPDKSQQPRGLQLLREAAEAGSIAACRKLAAASAHGVLGLTRSDSEARRWLTMAADRGDADAALSLARLERRAEAPDLRAARNWYEQAARNGSAEAAYELALLLERGASGFRKDPEAAARWMQQAAESGLPSAQLHFALMKLGGNGRPANPHEAFAWASKAAAKGNADASAQVAFHLVTGTGCPRDAAQARVWADRSATAGSAHGQTLLGLLLLRGDGGPSDPASARKWLEKAHSKGHPQATLELARLYRDGTSGIPPEPTRAAELFEQAGNSQEPSVASEAKAELASLRQRPARVALDGLRINTPKTNPPPTNASSRLDRLRIP